MAIVGRNLDDEQLGAVQVLQVKRETFEQRCAEVRIHRRRQPRCKARCKRQSCTTENFLVVHTHGHVRENDLYNFLEVGVGNVGAKNFQCLPNFNGDVAKLFICHWRHLLGIRQSPAEKFYTDRRVGGCEKIFQRVARQPVGKNFQNLSDVVGALKVGILNRDVCDFSVVVSIGIDVAFPAWFLNHFVKAGLRTGVHKG